VAVAIAAANLACMLLGGCLTTSYMRRACMRLAACGTGCEVMTAMLLNSRHMTGSSSPCFGGWGGGGRAGAGARPPPLGGRPPPPPPIFPPRHLQKVVQRLQCGLLLQAADVALVGQGSLPGHLAHVHESTWDLLPLCCCHVGHQQAPGAGWCEGPGPSGAPDSARAVAHATRCDAEHLIVTHTSIALCHESQTGEARQWASWDPGCKPAAA
jgi:hypothetical protein